MDAQLLGSCCLLAELAMDALSTHIANRLGYSVLLSPQEEKELGRKVQAVNEASKRFLARQITLDEKESIEQQGLEARNKMICANVRLVAAIAKQFTNRGISYNDLISEGYVGLIRAVEGFDPDNAKFSTYAVWWIKQAIKRALLSAQMVSLPDYMGQMVPKWMQIRSEFVDKYHYEPSIEEMASEFNVSVKKARQIWQAVIAKRSEAKGLESEEAQQIEDRFEFEEAPDTSVDRDQVRHFVESEAAMLLDDRSLKIIRLRFGFDHEYGESMTLKEVGERVGLTRERVRQIEQVALTSLRGAAQNTDMAHDMACV